MACLAMAGSCTSPSGLGAASVPAGVLVRWFSVLAACGLAAINPAIVRGQDASVSGVVYDSIAKRPLSGATVQLVDAADPVSVRSLVTPVNGSFNFDSVAAGTYLLGFIHQTLDSLGVAPPLLRVNVTNEARLRAPLAVPSAATVVRLHCGTAADSGGAWLGTARSAVSGLPVRDAEVRVQWSAISVLAKRVVRETPEVRARSGESGFFVACHLPAEQLVVARATADEDSSGVLTVLTPADGLLKRDVFVAPVELVRIQVNADSLPADSGVTVTVRAGSGGIRGRVVAGKGKPVRGARIRLSETGAEAESNQNGYYALDSLPLGSFTFDVRALGYLPVSLALDVVATEDAQADFALETREAFLDTVRVLGTRLLEDQTYRDFLARQKSGFGSFFDEQEMIKRDPIYLTDMLRLVPGAIAVPGSFGGSVLFRSLGGGGHCAPTVIVDGVRMAASEGGVLDFIPARDVRAMEVYTRASNIPLQYRGFENCGVVVITTGRRNPARWPR